MIILGVEGLNTWSDILGVLLLTICHCTLAQLWPSGFCAAYEGAAGQQCDSGSALQRPPAAQQRYSTAMENSRVGGERAANTKTEICVSKHVSDIKAYSYRFTLPVLTLFKNGTGLCKDVKPERRTRRLYGYVGLLRINKRPLYLDSPHARRFWINEINSQNYMI